MATMTISLPARFVSQINIEAKNQGATRSEFFRTLIRKYFTERAEFKPFVRIPLKQLESELKKSGKHNDKFIKSVVKGFSKSSVYAS